MVFNMLEGDKGLREEVIVFFDSLTSYTGQSVSVIPPSFPCLHMGDFQIYDPLLNCLISLVPI
jgi:hypothetical protein